MGKIKGWTKVSGMHDSFSEWQNETTKQRVLYHPYGLTNKYKITMETREGVKEGIVSNKHSANFSATRYMRGHPNG